MTLTVPIPGKKDKIPLFYIQYDLNSESYTNYAGDIFIRDSDSIAYLR